VSGLTDKLLSTKVGWFWHKKNLKKKFEKKFGRNSARGLQLCLVHFGSNMSAVFPDGWTRNFQRKVTKWPELHKDSAHKVKKLIVATEHWNKSGIDTFWAFFQKFWVVTGNFFGSPLSFFFFFFFFFFEGPICTWPIPALTLGTADVARKDPNCAKIDLFWPATWFLRVLDYRRFPWEMTNVPKSTGSQLFQTESQLIFPGSGPFSKSFKLHLSILAKRWRKWDWVLLKMAVE
jgi:hypothetical protein